MKAPCQMLATSDRAKETKNHQKSASAPIIPEGGAEIKRRML